MFVLVGNEKVKASIMYLNNIIKTATAYLLFTSLAWAQAESESLSLGTNLDLPDIGEPYLADKLGEWSLQCIRTQDGNDPCEMNQLLLNAEGQPMSEISLFRLPGNEGAVAGANIIVPLETLLSSPLIISFNAETSKQYPYSFCNAIGCIARIGLTNSEVDLLKKGKFANITVTHISRPNQPITFGMSLKGFTAAYSRTSIITR